MKYPNGSSWRAFSRASDAAWADRIGVGMIYASAAILALLFAWAGWRTWR